MSIISTNPAFVPAAERAVDALWAIAGGLSSYAADNDPAFDLPLEELVADAMSTSMLGVHLLGERDHDAPPRIEILLPQLTEICDDLIEHSTGLDDYAVLEFVGFFCDVHRGVKRLGFLA